MASRRVALTILMVLLFYLPSNAIGDEDTSIVSQFGVGFDEVTIADSTDSLSDPRDLEFHPGRANELWVANRATDSITIVHNTGLDNQTSENREDSNRNHFLEEVSAISFGSYHPEFDWQWGSAQETVNTYCGLGEPNNFMGPTLWPSSLNHFAVENQAPGGLLGSHLDMNHESPYGVGIAHDSGNSYWYNDGYYGELVYYDFQEDHDTGQDDHSDSLVRRYSDIQLTHSYGIPGHMILDKSSGILYISDPGANRVIWVNTDDPTYNTQNIYSESSRLEPLEEYSRITGIEWGVLASGLDSPTGIALEGDQLFVSLNGNGKIVAYDLNANGKGGTEADFIQTTASSIMGLEIGPNGHLYYVDNGQDEVVRIDPYTDADGDGIIDENDNCPLVANPNQVDHDSDLIGDSCDDDDDNDGILDILDDCATGKKNWNPSAATDYDMDGCEDESEDYDDDNDAVLDSGDNCAIGEKDWTSNSTNDFDSDGCKDSSEDLDDDNDNICDSGWDESWGCLQSSVQTDICPQSALNFYSNPSNDADQDGCEDRNEDEDDDNDGFIDKHDDCPIEAGLSDSGKLIGCPDYDGDGYADTDDVFPEEPSQWSDIDEDGFGDEENGLEGDGCITTIGTSTEDRRGCLDSDGDGWSNPDSGWTVTSGADALPNDETQHLDRDGDGYGDNEAGFQADLCPDVFGTSTSDKLGCLDSDGDGWSDAGDMLPLEPTQYVDMDLDGYGDSANGNNPDSCPELPGTSTQTLLGCPDLDGDGWADPIDGLPDNSDYWEDDCPDEVGTSFEDRTGCLDSDGDGWSDASDDFPNDASRYVDSSESSNSYLLIISGVVVIIALLGLVMVYRKRNSSGNIQSLAPNPVSLAPLITQNGPPLPPEGLPSGWTMEQWAWYGEDYLKSR